MRPAIAQGDDHRLTRGDASGAQRVRQAQGPRVAFGIAHPSAQLYHRRATAWILQLGDPGLEYARLADAEFGARTDGRAA